MITFVILLDFLTCELTTYRERVLLDRLDFLAVYMSVC
jgi:hypothetical protein